MRRASLPAGCMLVLSLLAGCSFMPAASPAQDTPAPTPAELFIPIMPNAEEPASTSLPPAEPAKASGAFVVVEQSHQEQVATGTLTYTLEVTIPMLEPEAGGELSEAAAGWNGLLERETNQIVEGFIQAVNQLPPDMALLSPGGSFLSITPKLVYSDTQTLSVLLAVNTYMSGAAHPGTVHRAYNYNMQVGELYSWSDIFVPGLNEAEYLQLISKACVAKLKAQPGSDPDQGGWLSPGFETAGAAPIPENYRVWNITRDGLLFTFEEYQIAPYAAGPQQVLLLKSEMAGWLNPEGPFGETAGGK